jgi:LAGLIDADG-like domain
MKQTELAWAAGFFDGEGCFANNGTKYGTMRVNVSQITREPLERFQKALGVEATIHFKKNGGVTHPERRIYQFVVTADENVLGVVKLLWPYLCGPKRRQAIRMLSKRARAQRALKKIQNKQPSVRLFMEELPSN